MVIHDRSYARWDGDRSGHVRAVPVIAEQGMNTPGLVAKGISVALITTASGLIVAVITLPFYNFFSSRIAVYVREMETSSNILLETFGEMETHGGAQPPAAPSAAPAS